jgi:folylpolyglutamate synthase/dihydropteroate synthase
MEPGDLLRAWRRVADGGATATEPASALEHAAARARADQPVVVAGSLYLVGAVRGMLLGERSDA